MKLLKQSTAVTIKLGPFLDSTDGVTAKTALTLAQADILLSKNFGAIAQKNDSTSATHDSGGWYGVPLNTTDTATVGALQIYVNKSSALPVWDHYTVVPSHVYNGLVAGTGNMNVNIDSLGGNTSVVAPWLAAVGTITTGTVDNTAFTATTSVLETSSVTTAASDHWVGRVILFTSGTLALQATRITAYSLNTGRGRFTYNTVTSAPANGVSFVII
jgi:hypothetical protein